MKVVISKKTHNRHLYKGEGDFHTKEGIIYESQFKDNSSSILNNKEREHVVFDAQNQDKLAKIKRGPQNNSLLRRSQSCLKCPCY